MCTNVYKYVQVVYKCVQVCTIVYKYLQVFTSVYRCVKVCTIVYRYVQVCKGVYKCGTGFVQLCKSACTHVILKYGGHTVQELDSSCSIYVILCHYGSTKVPYSYQFLDNKQHEILHSLFHVLTYSLL